MKGAMRYMKKAVCKIWEVVKNTTITVTGKFKLGFVEIAVVPGHIPQTRMGLCFLLPLLLCRDYSGVVMA